MKDYAEEPKIGPTENKEPTTIRVKHSDLPGIEKAGPGDRVHLVVHGHVHSNRAKDKFGDGEAAIDVHSIEHSDKPVDNPKEKKNASTMRMDELKAHLKALSEKDEDMEGHVEDGIKEEGKSEVGKDAHQD